MLLLPGVVEIVQSVVPMRKWLSVIQIVNGIPFNLHASDVVRIIMYGSIGLCVPKRAFRLAGGPRAVGMVDNCQKYLNTLLTVVAGADFKWTKAPL